MKPEKIEAITSEPNSDQQQLQIPQASRNFKMSRSQLVRLFWRLVRLPGAKHRTSDQRTRIGLTAIQYSRAPVSPAPPPAHWHFRSLALPHSNAANSNGKSGHATSEAIPNTSQFRPQVQRRVTSRSRLSPKFSPKANLAIAYQPRGGTATTKCRHPLATPTLARKFKFACSPLDLAKSGRRAN